jgi:hypothetical protein
MGLAAMQRALLLSQYKIGIVIYRLLKPMHGIPLHNLNKQWQIASLSGWVIKESITADGTAGIGQSSPIRVTLKEKFY